MFTDDHFSFTELGELFASFGSTSIDSFQVILVEYSFSTDLCKTAYIADSLCQKVFRVCLSNSSTLSRKALLLSTQNLFIQFLRLAGTKYNTFEFVIHLQHLNYYKHLSYTEEKMGCWQKEFKETEVLNLVFLKAFKKFILVLCP